MTAHSPQHIALAKAVLVTKLRHWDAQLALEEELANDIDTDGDTIGVICSTIREAEDVTDANAIALLDALKEEEED